jgi:uncharacterized protein DUF4180
MTDTVTELGGVRVLLCDATGERLHSERDAIDIVGAALSARCNFVVVPVERLDDAFFSLKTRIAGEIIQKFVNYELRLAIIGDIARHVEASTALRDFVFETNRGNQVWFLADRAELESRLGARKP